MTPYGHKKKNKFQMVLLLKILDEQMAVYRGQVGLRIE